MRRLVPSIAVYAGLLALVAALVALAVATERPWAGVEWQGNRQTALLLAGGACALGGLGLAARAFWGHGGRVLRRGGGPVGILLLATWCGLITGWGQTLTYLVRKEFQGKILGKGIDFPWMIPLTNLALFVLFGLLVGLLHRLRPRVVSRFVATFLLAWPAALGLVLLIPRVSPASLAVLAAGIAMVVARVATRYGGGFATVVRLGVGWPALLGRPSQANPSPPPEAQAAGSAGSFSPSRREFLLGAAYGIAAVALGTRCSLLLEERRGPKRSAASRADRPNVLLIVLDAVRAKSMSLYGYGRPTTPNLERLAMEGALFRCAIAPSSWTLPSHASMFTGRLPHEYAYGESRPVVTAYPFLAEVLWEAGYATAGFSANPHYCSREHSMNRGMGHWEDRRVTPGQALLYTSFGASADQTFELANRFGTNRTFGRKSAEQLNADFQRWVSRPSRRPFFAFLNYFDAHDPYLPPEAFALRFSDHTPRGFLTAEIARDLPEERVRELRDAYDGALAYLDQQIGAFFMALEELGLAEETLVVITSDHGEQFGEHGLLSHGNSLYYASIHVPLLFRWPGRIPSGAVVRAPVSLTDLPATLLELTGTPPGQALPGMSLAPLWHGASDEPRRVAYSEVDIDWYTLGVPTVKGLHRSLVSSEYHYILQPDGKEELYSLEVDAEELNDLSATPAGRQAIEQLRPSLPQA